MGTNTLSSYNTIGITLTNGGAYLSPFTITQAGAVVTRFGTSSVYSALTNPSLLNEGLITGGFNGINFTDGGTVDNRQAAAISGTYTAVYIDSTSGLVLNAGVINGGSFDGVFLGDGGGVTNTGNGYIYGFDTGVDVRISVASVTNFGTISGRSNDGVYLGAGGYLANSGLSATISGSTGVLVGDSFASVTNTGTITGTGDGMYFLANGYVSNSGPSSDISGFTGIDLNEGGVVVNAGTITGSGGYGVLLGLAGTVVNAGTIAGAETAVAFGAGDNRLVVDPGAVFIGAVSNGYVLELAAGAGQSTLQGIGTSFTGFNTIDFDGGANWLVSGNVAGFDNDSISGFAVVDTLDVTDLDFTGPSRVTADSAGVITILESGGGSFDLTFSSAYDDDVFTLTSDGAGGTDINEFHGYKYSNIYGFYDPGAFPSGYAFGELLPTGINEAGEVVGNYQVNPSGEGFVNAGFIYTDGSFTGFGPTIVGGTSVSGYYPAAVNDAGEVVGVFVGSLASRNAFIYDYGTLTTFAVPSTLTGPENAYATGINDSGVVAGYYSTSSSETAFIYDNGTVTSLPNPTDEDGDLNTGGINNSNQIVGWFFDGVTGTEQGFIYNNGTYTTLSGPGPDEWVQANAINDSGEVVGFFDTPPEVHGQPIEGFIYNNGTYTTLSGPPGALQVDPVAINDSGEVAGTYILQDGFTEYGFVYQNGTYTTIADPTGTNGSAGVVVNDVVTGLNNAGDVIGYYAMSGTEYGFIADPACFTAGTRIQASLCGIAVENLKIGDRLKTQNSGLQKIKWIGRRDYDGRFIAGNRDILPVCIKRHAIAQDIPSRDLWVSPGHAICIDGALIKAFRLVNGVSIIQAGHVECVSYYHIEMENHEVVFAENCPAETFMNETFRQQFQNADEYRALYPGEAATSLPCLPQLEDGFALQDIRQRLNVRAGIAINVGPLGRLRGFVDVAGPSICAGWAQDTNNPEEPVCLDILLDGEPIARVLANYFRADLRNAGLGSGCHAFNVALPSGDIGWLDVRRATDGAELDWSEAASADAMQRPGDAQFYHGISVPR